MKYRIGFGYDLHQLKPGLELWLGGLLIDHHQGAVGHSDADVLIHAICDALLGAANLGDIGRHFPDTSQAYKNIDSKILLERVVVLLKDKGYSIGNIDSTVVAEQPKLASIIPSIQKKLAEVCGVDEDLVSVKAKTNEKLGYLGQEQGIAAYAVCMIQKT
jgi:2-C-methyl-D-erythritol 2,4-cyclodiphosphate synthase